MIKSIKYFLFITLLLSFYNGKASISWDDNATQTFIHQLNNAISPDPGVFLDPEHEPLTFQGREGEDAVRFVLTNAALIEDWKTIACTSGCENIFSILGIAFLDGYLETTSNTLLEASKWLVRGLITGRSSMLWAGRAETFLKDWIDELELRDITIESEDASVEAAIKALHEKLLAERTVK